MTRAVFTLVVKSEDLSRKHLSTIDVAQKNTQPPWKIGNFTLHTESALTESKALVSLGALCWGTHSNSPLFSHSLFETELLKNPK